MRFSFTLPDPTMPRTIYFEMFAQALRRNRRFVEQEGAADICFPAEDVSPEMNWPRYGDMASAFVRGQFHKDHSARYIKRIVDHPRRMCVLSMHPRPVLTRTLAPFDNIFVADINFSDFERSLNPRTISLPAPAITKGSPFPNKTILASFRGAASHPCRDAMAAAHNGTRIICEMINPEEHKGKIDATKCLFDVRYFELLQRSVFALVPRGDCMFSYRLLEALSFGCVPVVISDGWVLPFDRTIRWHEVAICVSEAEASKIGLILDYFKPERIAQMQAAGQQVYQKCFATLDAVVETMLGELEGMLPAVQSGPRFVTF